MVLTDPAARIERGVAMRFWTAGVLIVAAACGAAGCGGPTVTITHHLPGAVPMPDGVTSFRAGTLSLEGFSEGGITFTLTKMLGEKLKGLGRPGGSAVIVNAVARATVSETKGTARLRRWNAETRTLDAIELPALVRTVDVETDFTVTRPGGGEIVTVETRRSYSSAEDPRIRGELGLQRPDDPVHVPATGRVVRELVGECADALCRMLAPDEIPVELSMRPTWIREGRAGLAAAGKGDYGEAKKQFEAGLKRFPNSKPLWFNLGLAAEAADDLETALAAYDQLVTRSGGRDTEADEGATRTRRILIRRRPPGG